MTELSKAQFDEPKVYAVKHKDSFEVMASQSGGAFAALSDTVLEQGGVVYGCAFNESFQAVHIRADTVEQRNRMRYSKYVQSNMGDTYKNVLKDLEEGRTVLFTGTSCQVAGIKNFLGLHSGKIKGTLYCVDIVCHGVPSPLVWRDYLSWERKKNNANIEKVVCRNKQKYGWKSHIVTIYFDNRKSIDRKVFPRLFYSHLALRPSCYQCPYKSILHPSDITIADYWGIEKALPQFNDNKGVSLVLINNATGESLFAQSQNRMIFHETRIEDSMQKPLIEPYNPPPNRKQFWIDYHKLPFDKIAKIYGEYSALKEYKWKFILFVKRNIMRKK